MLLSPVGALVAEGKSRNRLVIGRSFLPIIVAGYDPFAQASPINGLLEVAEK